MRENTAERDRERERESERIYIEEREPAAAAAEMQRRLNAINLNSIGGLSARCRSRIQGQKEREREREGECVCVYICMERKRFLTELESPSSRSLLRPVRPHSPADNYAKHRVEAQQQRPAIRERVIRFFSKSGRIYACIVFIFLERADWYIGCFLHVTSRIEQFPGTYI